MAERPSDDGPGNLHARGTPLDNRSTSRADGHVKRRAAAGLRHRGARVETQAGNATGDVIADRTPGTGNPQAGRRTKLDKRLTSQEVGSFDVCSNAAVNSDLPCFLQAAD